MRALRFCIALIFAAACILSGCAIVSVPPASVAAEFLTAISTWDFQKAYSYTWNYSARKYTEEEFCEKYDAIFKALSVGSFTWSDIEIEDGDWGCTAKYTATYETEYGTIKDSFRMQLYPAEGSYAIDYSPALIFPEMDFGDTVRVSTNSGSRGEIFTADGELLVENGYAQTVYVDLETVEDINAAAQMIYEHTGVGTSEILEKFNKASERGSKVTIIDKLRPGTLSADEIELMTAVKGVGVDVDSMTPIRLYPMGEYAAHLTGYATESDGEDKKKLASGSDLAAFTGREGLEASYNEQMNETSSVSVYIRDEAGNKIRVLYGGDEISDGQDIWTTIDSKLQERSYLALLNYLNEEQSGAVVILNADTGAVESAVSYPSYDPNEFVLGISEEKWAEYTDPELGANSNLYSRFAQGTYPPGSSLKPFTAVPALESGVITADTVFPSSERVVEKKWTPSFEEWPYTPITRKDEPDSPDNLTNAMKISDNVYFAWAALMLGEDGMYDFLSRVGFDTPLSFDIPVSTGNIMNEGTSYNRKLLADMGYGQGELEISPIQLASMFTAFLNGGDMLSPFLVEHTAVMRGEQYVTVEEQGRKVHVSGALKQSTIDTLLPILKQVMSGSRGTGNAANIRGAELAGKTGTAEIGSDKKREIGWIIAFYTEGENRRLVCVMVDGPATEGSTKVAVAKELLGYGVDIES